MAEDGDAVLPIEMWQHCISVAHRDVAVMQVLVRHCWFCRGEEEVHLTLLGKREKGQSTLLVQIKIQTQIQSTNTSTITKYMCI